MLELVTTKPKAKGKGLGKSWVSGLVFIGATATGSACLYAVGYLIGCSEDFLGGFLIGAGVGLLLMAIILLMDGLKKGRSLIDSCDEREKLIILKAGALTCFVVFFAAVAFVFVGNAGLIPLDLSATVFGLGLMGVVALAFGLSYFIFSLIN